MEAKTIGQMQYAEMMRKRNEAHTALMSILVRKLIEIKKTKGALTASLALAEAEIEFENDLSDFDKKILRQVVTNPKY